MVIHKTDASTARERIVQQIFKRQFQDAEKRDAQGIYPSEVIRAIRMATVAAQEAVGAVDPSLSDQAFSAQAVAAAQRAKDHFTENWSDEDRYGSATFQEIIRDFEQLGKGAYVVAHNTSVEPVDALRALLTSWRVLIVLMGLWVIMLGLVAG
ncbi:hypothetical protein [Magnetofaba australis]|uniref:Uncharacterized protein n=1 Tax=Magnetofaba australis IT-1 TaxID=1434232 RepID=A0A1Y2K6W6_9PROT|nr:hypothetical protein [Magnetofaba australis]OSM05293.1 hypothetical protein MAIT1_03467 [Magnetofaba australis IT-1]